MGGGSALRRAALLACAVVGLAALSGPATPTVSPAASAAVAAVAAEGQVAARVAGADDGRRLLGRKGDFSWLVQGARWDACRTLVVAVETRKLRGGERARKAFVREVRWATGRISEASGLRFRVVRRSVPVPQPDVRNPAGVDIVVAWARPKESRWLTDADHLGYAGATAEGTRLRDGFVVMNAAQPHRYPASQYRGDRRAWNRRITTLHELSHAVGAGHARSRSQVMYPTLAGKAYRFGRGDRTIMRRLGADRAACS